MRRLSAGPCSLTVIPTPIIGVMPRGFPPPFLAAELWTPLGITQSAPVNEARTYIVTIAQLADGATLQQADAEVRAIVADLTRELPRTHQGWTGGVITFRDWQYGSFHAPLFVLFLAVIVLLLIASSNVASLTLAHVTARSGELALRRAIGATRWDLARLVLAEITIMNAVGAAFAVILGAWFLPALLAIAPATTRVLGEVRMDWRVAIYAMGCAVLASIGAGVVPAMTASDSAAINASATRSTGSRDRQRWRALLLATQTALCVALLVVGGLLVRALVRTSGIGPGYDPDRVLTAQLQLPPSRYANGPERVAAMERIFERVAAIPGVVDAGATMNRFTPGFSYQTLVEIDGQRTPDGSGHTVQFRRVSASYFKTMRIRVLSGRAFAAQDSLSTPAVAIVSRSFAQRFWPGGDPIGWRIQRGTVMATVVGVVDDVSDVDLLQSPEPTLYAAWTQTANVAFPWGWCCEPRASPRPSRNRCGRRSPAWIRCSRSIGFRRSRRSWPTRWRRRSSGRRSCSVSRSRACCLAPSASPASRRGRSRNGCRSSACGWRWGVTARRCGAAPLPPSSASSPLARPAGWRSRSSPAGCWRRFSRRRPASMPRSCSDRSDCC